MAPSYSLTVGHSLAWNRAYITCASHWKTKYLQVPQNDRIFSEVSQEGGNEYAEA